MLTKTAQSQSDILLRGPAKYVRDEARSVPQGEKANRNIFDLLSAKPIPQTASVNPYAGLLSQKDLIELYQSIEAALPGVESRIVQFASCNRHEGATAVGTSLAAMASGLLGKRTLLIDVYPGSSPPSFSHKNATASLTDVASGRALTSNAVALSPVGATPFDYTYLSANPVDRDILSSIDKLKHILMTLRTQYRLIIFHTSNVLGDPLGVAVSSLCDGVALVVEAESTRSPAAKQAVQLLSRKGAKIIGMVFNKRRYHIPNWLYRRL